MGPLARMLGVERTAGADPGCYTPALRLGMSHTLLILLLGTRAPLRSKGHGPSRVMTVRCREEGGQGSRYGGGEQPEPTTGGS